MRLTLQLLVAVLVLAGSLFASPRGNDRDKHHHSVPEPGSIAMVTLTAGTLVGGMFARRRMKSSVNP
jgi:hypothetical protein